jgi:hypothetical protein
MLLFSLTVIVSCLGDEGQKITVDSQPGVVIKPAGSDTTRVQLKDRTIYDERFGSSVNDGNCVLVKYNIDYGLFANADTGRREGFFKAEILASTIIEPHELYTEITDTSIVVANEQMLKEIKEVHSIIRNHLFLYTEHPVDSTELHNLFDLSYNADQVPVVDETIQKPVYNLFLRVVKNNEAGGKVSDPQKIFINAFDITELLSNYNTTDTLYFRVNFAKSFDKDTLRITSWSNRLFRYPPILTGRKQ